MTSFISGASPEPCLNFIVKIGNFVKHGGSSSLIGVSNLHMTTPSLPVSTSTLPPGVVF